MHAGGNWPSIGGWSLRIPGQQGAAAGQAAELNGTEAALKPLPSLDELEAIRCTLSHAHGGLTTRLSMLISPASSQRLLFLPC